MFDDDPLDPLGMGLAAEAQRLLEQVPAGRPLAYVREELAQRRRRRIVMPALMATTALVLTGFVAIIAKLATDQNGAKTVGSYPPVRPLPNTSLVPQPFVLDAKPDFDLAQVSEPMPILIEWPGPGGRPRYEAVWYIPGQFADVEWTELSPSEQSAVSQLLGPEYDETSDEVI